MNTNVISTGLEQQPLPLYLRVANKVAVFLGSNSDSFQPERIFAAAAKHAGLPAQFPSHVEEAVTVLCRSIREDGDLHWLGRVNQHSLLVTGLSTLLKVEKAFADDPDLINTPLVPPLVVVGLPRSGTTFLHRLLAAAPNAKPISLYEHAFPIPYQPIDYRQLEIWLKFLPWLSASNTYGVDAMHYIRPKLPDECNFGLRIAGRSMIYCSSAPLYSYFHWLLAQDLRESYQLYRKVLILHQINAPNKRITLKCPQHLAWMPALTEALPEALIVQTHRDPIETIPSESKLVLSLHALSTDHLDWKRTVDCNYQKVQAFANRAVAFADSPAGRNIKHIDYRDLVRDSVGTVSDIYAHFGLEFTQAHTYSLENFAKENRQHKHGRNSYTVEQFELDPEKIKTDFTAYYKRFLK